jgi:hypothetical protein
MRHPNRPGAAVAKTNRRLIRGLFPLPATTASRANVFVEARSSRNRVDWMSKLVHSLRRERIGVVGFRVNVRQFPPAMLCRRPAVVP